MKETIDYLDRPYAGDKYSINAVGEYSSTNLFYLNRKEVKKVFENLLNDTKKELAELNHETKN